jgi:hypothetical protein
LKSYYHEYDAGHVKRIQHKEYDTHYGENVFAVIAYRLYQVPKNYSRDNPNQNEYDNHFQVFRLKSIPRNG